MYLSRSILILLGANGTGLQHWCELSEKRHEVHGRASYTVSMRGLLQNCFLCGYVSKAVGSGGYFRCGADNQHQEAG